MLCDGLPVSAIDIETRRPSFRGPMAVWRRFAHWLGLRNTETQETVVRRYVTLDPRQPCTEFRRAESERLLRAQPFIARASVQVVPSGRDSVRLLVETVDEVPALVAARYRGRDWALALGNENTFGTGMRTLVRAEQRDNYRDGYGLELEHRQLFGRPYVLGLQAVRHPVGDRWLVELGHAFLTDLQRVAWHTGAAQRRDYVRLRHDEGGATLALPLRQTTWDVGGVIRLGPPGWTFLNGGVLTRERVVPDARALFVTDTGFAAVPDGDVIASRYAGTDNVRANFVTGFRRIHYTQGRGFDALTAEQDLANGVQVTAIVGRSVPRISADDDGFLAAELFAGASVGRRSYFGFQIDGEARRAFGDTTGWDGILGSTRAAWYFKPATSWTSIASVEWAGGWRERIPFLLELGDRRGGVRGFAGVHLAGSRRAVARLEERYIIGAVRGRGDLGVAAFGEAGKVWRGDASFGETSPLASSVGVSVLAAVPAGGQRLYRMDVAFPVRGPHRGVELRFGAADRTRHFWETPDDVMRARAAGIPRRIVDWP